MSVFVGETYIVKPDKVAENAALLQKLVKLIKEKPAAFKGLKSYKAYSEAFGTFGYFVEVWEFGEFSEFQNMFAKFMEDSELKKIPEAFLSFIIPGTYQQHVWSAVAEHAGKK